MKLLILSVLLFSAIATFSSAVTLKEFLFEGDAPSDLSKSTDLARKEQERILNLIEEVNGLTLVLPSNSAWKQMPGVYEKIYSGKRSDLVHDVFLSTAAEMKVADASSWSKVQSYIEQNGAIDTAYGASFVLGGSKGSVCLAQWATGGFTSTNKCIELELPPIVLDDGVVYIANGLLLPDDLQEEVDQLI